MSTNRIWPCAHSFKYRNFLFSNNISGRTISFVALVLLSYLQTHRVLEMSAFLMVKFTSMPRVLWFSCFTIVAVLSVLEITSSLPSDAQIHYMSVHVIVKFKHSIYALICKTIIARGRECHYHSMNMTITSNANTYC